MSWSRRNRRRACLSYLMLMGVLYEIRTPCVKRKIFFACGGRARPLHFAGAQILVAYRRGFMDRSAHSTFAALIRDLVTRYHGGDVRAFADSIGVAATAVYHWMSGFTRAPSIANL